VALPYWIKNETDLATRPCPCQSRKVRLLLWPLSLRLCAPRIERDALIR